MDSSSTTLPPDTLSPHSPATDAPEWRQAAEAGWDMSLVAESMRLTVWQRIQQHRSSLALATMLREAVTKPNA